MKMLRLLAIEQSCLFFMLNLFRKVLLCCQYTLLSKHLSSSGSSLGRNESINFVSREPMAFTNSTMLPTETFLQPETVEFQIALAFCQRHEHIFGHELTGDERHARKVQAFEVFKSLSSDDAHSMYLH